MVRADYFDNPDHLPDYYDTMYLDGFEPWQILEAAHRTLYKRYLAQKTASSLGKFWKPPTERFTNNIWRRKNNSQMITISKSIQKSR